MNRRRTEQIQYHQGEPLRLFEVSVVWSREQVWSVRNVNRIVLVAWNRRQALTVAKTAVASNDPSFAGRRLRAREVGYAVPEVQACEVLAVQTMGIA